NATHRPSRHRRLAPGTAHAHRACLLRRTYADRDCSTTRPTARHRENAHAHCDVALARRTPHRFAGRRRAMTHEQFRELLPLYVVGAVDGEELLEFERYVAGGRERCAPEVAEFQVIADQLVYAAPAAQPSPGVFGRVLAGISEAAPAGAPVPVRQQPFAWGALFFGWIPWTATAVVATVLVITTGQLRQMTQQSTRISELS